MYVKYIDICIINFLKFFKFNLDIFNFGKIMKKSFYFIFLWFWFFNSNCLNRSSYMKYTAIGILPIVLFGVFLKRNILFDREDLKPFGKGIRKKKYFYEKIT